MLEKLIKNKVRDLYVGAVIEVEDFARKKCVEIGLNPKSYKLLLQADLEQSSRPDPDTELVMAESLVNGLELALTEPSEPQATPEVNNPNKANVTDDVLVTQKELDALIKPMTKTDLKAAPVGEVRKMCEAYEIETKTPEGKNVDKDTLIAKLLAKQDNG